VEDGGIVIKIKKPDFGPQINKRMKVMLVILSSLFGSIFIYKILKSLLMMWFMAHYSHIVTVSAMKAEYAPWQPQIKAVGSLRAVRGVDVTTEIAGLVKFIHFVPGSNVKQNTILVELNADSEKALLKSLQANADLAKITYSRDKLQFEADAISKQTLDADAANLKSFEAQVAQQQAILDKKTIKAPFDGRLGISLINPGQYVNPGDKIVSLQTLDPVYVDFFVPQQSLAQLQVGQHVSITSETFPNKIFMGKITTINPAIDNTTRNVEVEATISNPHHKLTPGMFVSLIVDTGPANKRLTLPQTAISFNPYGELVFMVQEKGSKWNKKLFVQQSFVVTGETHGDQIEILQGLKEGDLVVTSGQLKLKNGSEVTIDNSITPSNSPTPEAPDDH
jgi:membrane fusion protein, multidrug efflux system